MTRIIHGERVGKLGRLAVGCSAGILDVPREKILLVRRADTGTWCVPRGYMGPGESVTEGCAREVWEETGLRVRVQHLVGVYNNPHILLEYADGNRWLIVAPYFTTLPGEGVGAFGLINGNPVATYESLFPECPPHDVTPIPVSSTLSVDQRVWTGCRDALDDTLNPGSQRMTKRGGSLVEI